MKRSAIKWLIKNSKSQRANLIWLILANAFFSVMTVGFAYVIKLVIDGAINRDKNLFIIGVIIILSIVLLQFVFRLLISGLTEHIKGKLEITYKTLLFNEILKKKYKKVTEYHSGELLNRLTADVSVVAEGMATILPTVIASVTRLILAVVVLCLIDWLFALAFVIAGLMVFLVIGLLRKKLKTLHKKSQETEGKTRSFMQECLENILAIKVFSVTKKTKEIADDLQEKNFKVKMQRRNYTILGNSTYNFIFSAGYIFALIFGAVKLFNGTVGFGYGDLSAILQLVNSVQVPFATLSGVMPKLYSTTASAERIMEIEELEEDYTVQMIEPLGLYEKMDSIEVKDVSFTYGDREKVYDGASLSIVKGQSVAITGVSGVGKSTIMKLLLGVYLADKGEIYFNVKDQKVPASESTRSMFAYVPQGNMLFSGTLKDNVTFVNTFATDEQIKQALITSCSDEFVDELPEKLNTVVGEKGVGLSEGQIQRIAIARALLCDSPVILLDEATSALDEQTELKLLNNLKGLNNVTLIIITHKKAALDICNKRIEIKNKKVKTVV